MPEIALSVFPFFTQGEPAPAPLGVYPLFVEPTEVATRTYLLGALYVPTGVVIELHAV